MSRGNSALKSKMPKVVKFNRERAVTTMMRVEGGQKAVLADAGIADMAVVPALAMPASLEVLEGVGAQSWRPEGDDEAMALAYVVNVMGVSYDRLLDVPKQAEDLVDPVAWTKRVVADLVRAAGQSPRCAFLEGLDDQGAYMDPVVITDYTGPAQGYTKQGHKVTVFYPYICKLGDSTARLTAEPNMAQEWASKIHPANSMRHGISKIMLTARRQMIWKALNTDPRLKHEVLMEISASDIVPDLVPEEDRRTPKYIWAGPCSVTHPDGSVTVEEAHEGTRGPRNLIRTRETEYLETGSKRISRAAEEGAIQTIGYLELLDYVREHDNPYRASDKGKVVTAAAFLLFLTSQDSLRELNPANEVDSDVLQGKMAQHGLKSEEIDPERQAKALHRMAKREARGDGALGNVYGKMASGAIFREWRGIVPFPFSAEIIKKAQGLLRAATNHYWEAVSYDEATV